MTETRFDSGHWLRCIIRVWLNLVERYVRDVEAGGSNPLTLTKLYDSLMKQKLTTNQKGEISKLKIEIRAQEKGWIVSRTVDSARYDLILDDGTCRYRVQAKYASGATSHSEGTVQAELRRNAKTYSKSEIDVIIVYVPQIDMLCWFNPECFHNKTALVIRYAASKYNIKNARMAKDFEW